MPTEFELHRNMGGGKRCLSIKPQSESRVSYVSGIGLSRENTSVNKTQDLFLHGPCSLAEGRPYLTTANRFNKVQSEMKENHRTPK